jgi:hypothetical protein
MNARRDRLGQNETLFRELNERLEALNQTFSVLTEKIEFVCECAQSNCIERFSMEVADYERVRADPTTFAVKPGHEVRDVEDVVEERPEFMIVRKRPGGPAEVAIEEDPRS